MTVSLRRALTHNVLYLLVAVAGLIVLPASTAVWGQTDTSVDGVSTGEDVSTGEGAATDGTPRTGTKQHTLAPAIPTVQTPIREILLREVPIAQRGGLAMRVIRLGEAGTLSDPGVLDLPEEGGLAMRPLPFDWIRAIDRSIEVRQRGSFVRLAVVEEGAQVIVVHRSRIELLTGIVEMTRRNSDAIPLAVGAGEIEVYGRGRAVIERTPMNIAISVTSGQFEVYDDGALVGILAAGNDRSFPVTESSFDEDLSNLRTALSEVVVTLRSVPAIDGDTLSDLWAITRRVAAGFAYREESYDPRVHDPDLIRRDVGEALRILKAFRFGPAEALGM